MTIGSPVHLDHTSCDLASHLKSVLLCESQYTMGSTGPLVLADLTELSEKSRKTSPTASHCPGLVFFFFFAWNSTFM